MGSALISSPQTSVLITSKFGFSSPPPPPPLRRVCFPVVDRNRMKRGAMSWCAAKADHVEIEEVIEMKKMMMSEKCKEVEEIEELMECLEREAMMGEDGGREACDYYRRAIIFDVSSRVFHKQQPPPPSPLQL